MMGRTRGLPWDVDTASKAGRYVPLREGKKNSDTLKLVLSYLIDYFIPVHTAQY
jgi:hypothetical protein